MWACLHLPRLPLEALGGPFPAPAAVLGEDGHLLLPDRAARARGVRPGQPPAAALALCPGLRLLPRDREAERRALERLALWAGAFTPRASLAGAALLLDMSGGLRLFGGPRELLRRLAEGAAGLGHRAGAALAPTPRAALWLARGAPGSVALREEELPGALGPLPLEALGLAPEGLRILRASGLRRVGELLALPREGLARRLPGLPEALDRALGRLPDPWPPWHPPERFQEALELPAETASREALLFAAHRLLGALAGHLTRKEEGAVRLGWRLEHPQGPPTRLVLGTLAPARDPALWLALLRERLARPCRTENPPTESSMKAPLERPVRRLALACLESAPLLARPAGLWEAPPREAEAPRRPPFRLVERLRARLGEERVHGLATFPDHRPERAWRAVPPQLLDHSPEASPGPPIPQGPWRPLSLVEPPRPLAGRDGHPWLDGPLELVEGPERIQGGWWEGGDVARDYYLARDGRGAWLWLFRDLRRGGWHLHGYFD